jgi:dihydrofolate synthase/folylpolyglutamate synthase
MALAGEHQAWNAALAVAALHRLGMPLSSDSVAYGLRNVSWPGRFEIIRPGVILDGAHNPQSAQVLADTWKRGFPGKQASLVFSAVGGKDIAGVLEILAPLASRIFLCPVDTPRVVSPAELAGYLPAGAPPHETFGSFENAFAAASSHEEPVLVAGSLFLVGEARALLTSGSFQPSSQ